GLRHRRTLGTPLALAVANRDHKTWTWAMRPRPPAGEPAGTGTKRVTPPRPGPAALAGVQEHGLDHVRNARERAPARHTAAHAAPGGGATARLAASDVAVAGEARREGGAYAEAVDAARRDRDTLGGTVVVRARNVPPGPGWYARKEDRLDARLA